MSKISALITKSFGSSETKYCKLSGHLMYVAETNKYWALKLENSPNLGAVTLLPNIQH